MFELPELNDFFVMMPDRSMVSLEKFTTVDSCEAAIIFAKEGRDSIEIQLKQDFEENRAADVEGDMDWRRNARTALKFKEREIDILRAKKALILSEIAQANREKNMIILSKEIEALKLKVTLLENKVDIEA